MEAMVPDGSHAEWKMLHVRWHKSDDFECDGGGYGSCFVSAKVWSWECSKCNRPADDREDWKKRRNCHNKTRTMCPRCYFLDQEEKGEKQCDGEGCKALRAAIEADFSALDRRLDMDHPAGAWKALPPTQQPPPPPLSNQLPPPPPPPPEHELRQWGC